MVCLAVGYGRCQGEAGHNQRLSSATALHRFQRFMSFADNLKHLPPIDHLAQLEILDAQGQLLASIPNQPGKAGSLAVYHALWQRHGQLDAQAAQEGLELFAEHTDKARQARGDHPNIDRLLDLVGTTTVWQVRVSPRAD